jgi:hypothetical protein
MTEEATQTPPLAAGNTAPAIYGAIAAIMGSVGPIGKDRENKQQNYSFRGVDDVYQALQALMAKHGVFTTAEILADRTEERTTSRGSALIYRVLKIRWWFWAPDGSCVYTDTIGEGMDSGDKASNKAMSVSHKYALLQVFCIPTEEAKDPENDHHEVEPPSRETRRQTYHPPQDDIPPADMSENFSSAPRFLPDETSKANKWVKDNIQTKFDPLNDDHEYYAAVWLWQKKVDEKYWNAIGEKMKDQEFVRLGLVAKEVMNGNAGA